MELRKARAAVWAPIALRALALGVALLGLAGIGDAVTRGQLRSGSSSGAAPSAPASTLAHTAFELPGLSGEALSAFIAPGPGPARSTPLPGNGAPEGVASPDPGVYPCAGNADSRADGGSRAATSSGGPGPAGGVATAATGGAAHGVADLSGVHAAAATRIAAPPGSAAPDASTTPAGTRGDDARLGAVAAELDTRMNRGPAGALLPPEASRRGAAGGSRVDAGAAAAARIDLNHASAAQLRALPGVGAKRAEAIIALRERLGRFQRPGDLLRVKGIGQRTLERLLPLVSVE